MRTCGCQAYLRVVFLPAGFQLVWISHPDAAVRCVIPSGLWTSWIPVSHGHVTQGSSLRWGHRGTEGAVFAQGELSCVNAGASQSPAQPLGQELRWGSQAPQKYTPVCLPGLSFVAGSSRNTEGLSRC